ncbi:unnamed protein product [Ilex paraguariensis]|uniref:Ribosomal protein S4 n=1 Tax=Ilex paraguariensis TaxID=185542 RepID=A0ABC8URC4_9AQUA
MAYWLKPVQLKAAGRASIGFKAAQAQVSQVTTSQIKLHSIVFSTQKKWEQTYVVSILKQESVYHHVGLRAAIVEFLKRRCLWTPIKKKKTCRQLQRPEKHQHQHQLLKYTNQITLQEWLVASPGFNKGCSTNGSIEYNIGGGVVEFPGRVYPSRHGDFEVLAASSGHRESFSVDRSMILKVDRGEMEDTSFSRSQSGKIKKRVRFKLPEVADIFILDSSNNTHFEK